jgi:RNA polymerase sigma factor (sigma-70 family)
VSRRQLDTVLQTVGAGRPTGPSDPELLERFTRTGDEAAFAALVRRHHPMVLGVCRRVLHHAQDAEDACQAVFLVLARKAASVRGREALAGWLYRVASRVATKARAAKRLSPAPEDLPGPDDTARDVSWREALAVLDEELVRLPAAYRAALVLCYLEGRTQDEAARQLGWTVGTLRGQLERAREKLRARMLRRGVSLPAALFGVALGGAATSTASATVIARLVVGQRPAVPARVAELAEEGARSMFTAKTKAGAALVFAAGVLAAALGVAAQPGGPPKDPPPAKAPTPPAVPAAKTDAGGDPLPDGAVLRLGTDRLRHAKLFALAFAADGKLASFGGDYTVRVWDPATGRLARRQPVEKETAHRFWGGCLSPDGRRVAVQRLDRVKVFDTETGKELVSVKLGSSFEATAGFSPDGRSLAVVDQDGKFEVTRLQLCDVDKNACRELCRVKGFHSDPAFSPDGKRVALAEGSNGVGVWEVATGREVLRFQPPGLLGGTVAFDPTGDVLAVLGAVNPPQAFHLVRVSTGQPPDGWAAPPVADFEWVRFTPDGSAVLCGGRKGLQWSDPKTGKVTHTVEGWAATPPAFSPDGRLVATGGENAIRVFETKTGRPAGPAGAAPDEEVHGATASSDGRWIVTKGGHTGTLHVWDASGQWKASIPSNRWGGRYPRFSPDGPHLFGVAADAIALVRWDFPGGKELARYTFDEPAKDHVYVRDFALSADGRRLAAFTQTVNRPGPGGPPVGGGAGGSDVTTLTIWDVATAERLVSRPVEEGRTSIGYGAFAPDLKWYFSGDQAIPVLGGSVLRLELPEKWSDPRQAALSPDGRLVAQHIGERVGTGTDRSIDWRRVAVNEVATGKPVLDLPTGRCGPLAFTPDGRGLVVTDPEAITRWDLATRTAVVRHKAPSPATGNYGASFASSLAVMPDGTRAVTGHRDTTALVWDLTVPARTQRRLTGRELEVAWADLAGEGGAPAYAAVWSLADAPADALPLFRKYLRPVTAPPAERVAALIARLEAPPFATREAAEKELRELGDAVRGALEAALKNRPTAEQKERLERLVMAAATPTVPAGDRLRLLRAIAVLELTATDDARKQLKELAGGASDARPTTEAAAALERLSRRAGK